MALRRGKRFARFGIGLAALIAGVAALTGCGSSDQQHHDGPNVVATSTWEAAFAEAAGATDVTVIVPPAIKHAPDYDPKPSDLAAVSHADYVLYAPFEGFATKIKDAAGSSAKVVAVDLDNSRDNVVKEVQRLGDMFGTRTAADKWLQTFGARYDQLATQIKSAWRNGRPPTVVAQTFMGFAAQLSGAQVLGTYGPDQVTAKQVADLSAAEPELVFANEQMDTGTVLPGTTARQLDLSNYPTSGNDLLTVYDDTATKISAALKG